MNPRLPGFLSLLQKIKYLRTIATELAYLLDLLLTVPKYDVLHVFSASYWSFLLAPTPAILIGKLYRRAIILNYRSGEAEDHLERWGLTALPTLRAVSRIVVPSGYLVAVFRKFNLNAQPVLNVVDRARYQFRPRTPLRPHFLANRNLEPMYNVSVILRAFALVQKRYPDATLVVAGDGSERERLEALAKELQLRNVAFLGQVPPSAMPGHLDRADIYLNASEIDNLPMSLVEAFAAGVPVVTTSAGGIPYIVTHGKTGLLVSRGDSNDMAESAIRLLEDQALAQRLIQAAHAECARYDWAEIRQQWVDLYHRLAGK